MPDWTYRTVLRPLMLSLGPERARRLAVATLGRLSRLPLGLAAIDFMGHMRADPRLRGRLGPAELPGPIALGAIVDPAGDALGAFSRFGAGLIEVGPVAERASDGETTWQVDLIAGTVEATAAAMVVSADAVAANLEQASSSIPVCIRIAPADSASVRRIVGRLEKHAAFFSVEPENVAAAAGSRPILVRIGADAGTTTSLAQAAMDAGASGVWIDGDAEASAAVTRSLRAALPASAIIIAGGVIQPDDARRVLGAGANAAVVGAGLIVSGPGLPKRCNEAILSTLPPSAVPEGLSLDAARRAWFWALLLGVAMFGGGLLALVIASTRVILPYDESMCGMTREQLASINPRLLPFMAHDRVSLAGTMLSIGIFYSALAWGGIRRGAHWAHVTVIVSAVVGFLTFFLFLGFGYFDPFHAFVSAVLMQFTVLCMVTQPSAPQPLEAQWRETAAWRRGQWGQLLFVMIGAVLVGAGLVISYVGITQVFVETDLAFMRTTAAQLRLSYDRLVPLIAHDRASLGGMLIANGIAVLLSALWGFRAGARWLWLALAWGGNIAFACAVTVHLAVGYGSTLHLSPAVLGWAVWNVALLLTKTWLGGSAESAEGVPEVRVERHV